MENLSYYLSVFRRRLPYFLIVTTIISAIAITVAYTLPPAYESRMILLVESAQIPEELATSTVRVPAFEQLQILQKQLLTRNNMLSIARKFDVLRNMKTMSPDEIVDAMRARTKISTTSRRLREAPIMTISFEAPAARTAAAVLNEYLTLIQQRDSEFRKGRAGDTLDFFKQEIERLSQDLDEQSARILKFKQANTDALPDSLQYRLDQQSVFQDRIIQINRDISDLKSQRTRLVQLYELTGKADTTPQAPPQTADERQLETLNNQLQDALAVYSPENPRVKMLEARIAQLKEKTARQTPAPVVENPDGAAPTPDELPPVLTIQLSEIDDRIKSLTAQKAAAQAQLETLSASINRTPEVSIVLDEMTRKYDTTQAQYDLTESRLSMAQTGDRIETRSRGQRISVIEQPAVPSEPTKPKRLLIAGGGTAFGIAAGLGLVLLMELLNTAARRPVDLVNKLGVTPLTTIPYSRTRGQKFRQRSLKLLLLLIILTVIPAAVYLVHIYYLPLDLLADRIMNKLGIRL